MKRKAHDIIKDEFSKVLKLNTPEKRAMMLLLKSLVNKEAELNTNQETSLSLILEDTILTPIETFTVATWINSCR